MALLKAAGLGGLAAICGSIPLKRLCLASQGRSARVSLFGGAALSRESLDVALIQAAVEAGASFLPETRAILHETDADSPERSGAHVGSGSSKAREASKHPRGS